MTPQTRFDTLRVRAVPVRVVYPDILGPMPEATLACWVDLGLNDTEIARYFGLDEGLAAALARPVRRRIAALKR